MISKIHLAFRIVRSVIWINKFNYTGSAYHRMGKRLTNKITSQIRLEDAPQFPANGKLKMQWYMADSIFACEQFNRLIGNTSTRSNREIYLLSGALLTMSDLIIDDVDMDMERVKTLKRPPTDFVPKDEIEKLYLVCYSGFFNSLGGEMFSRTKEYYELLFEAQVRSKRQFDPATTKEEVDTICKEKCGYSTLYLRSILTESFDRKEEPIWFELGGFIQYCNDAQDLHKDLKKNMRTFASVRPDLEVVKNDLGTQWNTTAHLIRSAPFQEQKKDDFLLLLYVMYMAIHAKLNAFAALCEFKFSFSRFASLDTKTVRTKTAPIRLMGYVFPKSFGYEYRAINS